MPAPIRLSAVTALPRHEALAAASGAISSAGGWVEDVHAFAGHAVTIRAAIDEVLMSSVQSALAAVGLLSRAEPFAPAGGERAFTLHLVFANPDEGVRREVPPIPG